MTRYIFPDLVQHPKRNNRKHNLYNNSYFYIWAPNPTDHLHRFSLPRQQQLRTSPQTVAHFSSDRFFKHASQLPLEVVPDR